MIKIFLDTEFTGLHQQTSLISLALVAETEARQYTYKLYNLYMKLTKEISECLFKEAKEQLCYSKIISYLLLCMILLSMLLTNKLLYIASVSIFTLSFINIYVDKKAEKLIYLAKKSHFLEFIYFLFENKKVYNELANIHTNIGHDTFKWLERNRNSIQGNIYNSPHEINRLKKMLWMIQENTFWNTNLYLKSYQEKIYKISIVSIVIFISILSILIFPNTNELTIKIGTFEIFTDTYQLIRIALLILSSSIILEEIKNALCFISASKRMKVLDDKISKIEKIEYDEFLEIFTEYHNIKEVTPLIPNNIYNKNNHILNESWKIRLNAFKETNLNESIKMYTNLLINMVNSNDFKWMLIGSASLSLQGVSLKVSDLDILTDKKGIELIIQNCRPFIIEEIKFKEEGDLKSYHGKLNVLGVNIDVIAEIFNKTRQGWLPHNDIDDHKIRIGNIYVRDINYEKIIYERIGDFVKWNLINDL